VVLASKIVKVCAGDRDLYAYKALSAMGIRADLGGWLVGFRLNEILL